jgi:hypothetical protein
MHALFVNACSPHVMHAVHYELELAGVSMTATLSREIGECLTSHSSSDVKLSSYIKLHGKAIRTPMRKLTLSHEHIQSAFFLLAKFCQKANFFTSGLFLAKFGPKKTFLLPKIHLF